MSSICQHSICLPFRGLLPTYVLVWLLYRPSMTLDYIKLKVWSGFFIALLLAFQWYSLFLLPFLRWSYHVHMSFYLGLFSSVSGTWGLLPLPPTIPVVEAFHSLIYININLHRCSLEAVYSTCYHCNCLLEIIFLWMFGH